MWAPSPPKGGKSFGVLGTLFQFFPLNHIWFADFHVYAVLSLKRAVKKFGPLNQPDWTWCLMTAFDPGLGFTGDGLKTCPLALYLHPFALTFKWPFCLHVMMSFWSLCYCMTLGEIVCLILIFKISKELTIIWVDFIVIVEMKAKDRWLGIFSPFHVNR